MKKVSVNRDACIRCGACYSCASDVFSHDAEGISVVIKDVIEDDNENAIDAMEGCPTGAIIMEDIKENCNCKDGEECKCEDCQCENCSSEECKHE